MLLAYTRVPGNAFSWWLRQALRWSRGVPEIPDEPKDDLFGYLDAAPAGAALLPASAPGARARAEAREAELRSRYALDPLRTRSSKADYRKNLYLLDILERAAEGLDMPAAGDRSLRAADIGSADFHYAFALERWFARGNLPSGAAPREVSLDGYEVDGHGIYPDLRSRKDWATAYARQTGNPGAAYRVADFGRIQAGPFDCLTWFYPFITAHHLLLWGLPLKLYRPGPMLERAFAALRPGGRMAVLAHTEKEHLLFLERARATGFRLDREGPAVSDLVDFHADVEERKFSIWTRP